MNQIKRGLLATSFLWAACQPAGDISIEQQEILGGQLADPADFPTVVAVLNSGICTGTLVAPRVVLTAAHCIDPQLLGFGSDAQVANNTFIVFDSSDINTNEGFFVEVSKTIPNPNFSINNLGDNDIGIIILSESIRDREPSPIDLDPGRNLIGSFVTQVGYGVSDQEPNAGVEVVLNAKEVSDCGFFGGSNALLVCYDQTDGTGKCSGDSGGPSFDAQGKVVGVTSFGDQQCVQFGADTRPSGERQFLQDTAADNLATACASDGFAFAPCGALDPDSGEDACQDDDGVCAPGCSRREDNDCERFGGCSVDVEPGSTSDVASMFALFGLFSLGLFLSRRKSR